MERIELEDLNSILESTAGLWDAVVEKTIFITGGTGFFGLWLLESFVFINKKLNLGANLVLLTRNKQSFIEKYPFIIEYNDVSFIEGDVVNFKYPDSPIDYIIHAATEASATLNVEQPLLMLDTIIKGTKQVLDLAVEKKVKSFLLTSSGAIYGMQLPTTPFVKEEYKGGPDINNFTSAYGEGKRIAELICSIYNEKNKVPTKIARCFAFVGPYLPLNKHFAIGNFIGNMLENIPIKINSDGSAVRSYLYASDLAIWLWTILLKGKDNYPYNVGSDENISVKELAFIVSGFSADNKGVQINNSNKGAISINSYVPSINRCKKELFLDKKVDLITAIKKTIKFYNKYLPNESK